MPLAAQRAMHRSRLGTIVIDCQGERLDEAAAFWSAALGSAAERPDDPSYANYRNLSVAGDEVTLLVQAVEHPSRVHLDIETDDVDAEVDGSRLWARGEVSQVQTWWVMEAPTGQRFCVVRPQRAGFPGQAGPGATTIRHECDASLPADGRHGSCLALSYPKENPMPDDTADRSRQDQLGST